MTACATGAYRNTTQETQLDWDIALIRLDRSFETTAGWLGVSAACTPGAMLEFEMVGYPAPQYFNDGSGTCVTTTCSVMFSEAAAANGSVPQQMRPVFNACGARGLAQECDASVGQSGSPLFEVPTANMYAGAGSSEGSNSGESVGVSVGVGDDASSSGALGDSSDRGGASGDGGMDGQYVRAVLAGEVRGGGGDGAVGSVAGDGGAWVKNVASSITPEVLAALTQWLQEPNP